MRLISVFRLCVCACDAYYICFHHVWYKSVCRVYVCDAYCITCACLHYVWYTSVCHVYVFLLYVLSVNICVMYSMRVLMFALYAYVCVSMCVYVYMFV